MVRHLMSGWVWSVGLIWLGVAGAGAEWVTDFWDGFGGTGGLNMNKWAYEHTYGQEDLTKNTPSATIQQASWRDAVYLTDAVSTANGVLSIRTYDGINPVTGEATPITGAIRSREDFRRGRFSARMRFEGQPGMWSAFWLYNNKTYQNASGRWVQDPLHDGVEVDIVENRVRDWGGNDISDIANMALHWNGYDKVNDNDAATWNDSPKPDYWGQQTANLQPTIGGGGSEAWHRYSVEWWANRYVFSIDDVVVWVTDEVDVTSPTNSGNPVSSNIDQWIILSSEVLDQRWTGWIPTGGYGALGSSSNGLVEVDWVKHETWVNSQAVVPEPAAAAVLLGLGGLLGGSRRCRLRR